MFDKAIANLNYNIDLKQKLYIYHSKIAHTFKYYFILVLITLTIQDIQEGLMKVGEQIYEIQRILDQTMIEEKPHYLIKWKGYSSVQSTWEPIENLLNALEFVHTWKLQSSPHSVRKQRLVSVEKKEKTKKIVRLQRRKECEKNDRLRPRKKFTIQSETDQEERVRADQSNQFEKQLKTNDYQSVDLEQIVQHSQIKKKRNDNSKQRIQRPTNREKAKIKEDKQKKSAEDNKDGQKELNKPISKVDPESEDLTGFKVVGKVTKKGISSVIWCFDWGNQKICEVQLSDGRKVNMRKEDVKRICPQKLLDYYEKLEKAKK